MRRIHDDHIHTRSGQGFNASRRLRTSAYRSTHQQATLVVLGGMGVSFGLLDILDGHHALEVESVVDDQHLFDAMAMQQLTYFSGGDPFLNSNQLVFGGHNITD